VQFRCVHRFAGDTSSRSARDLGPGWDEGYGHGIVRFRDATWIAREITKERLRMFTGVAKRGQPSRHSTTLYMAFQQASNKGTLVPGQKISVNDHTVQVEKYLSQGLSFTPTSVDLGNATLVRRIRTCLPR